MWNTIFYEKGIQRDQGDVYEAKWRTAAFVTQPPGMSIILNERNLGQMQKQASFRYPPIWSSPYAKEFLQA